MTTAAPSFSVPIVSLNPDGWGPTEGQEVARFADVPYAPFGRSDRLGRAADFSSSNSNNHADANNPNAYHRRDRFGPRRSTAVDTANTEEGESNAAFQLVDTTKANTTRRFVNPASKRRQQSQRLRQINARRNQGGNSHNNTMDRMSARNARGGRGGGRGRGGRGGNNYYRGRYQYHPRIDRQPSVAVQSDWTLMEDIDLAKLNKNLTTSTVVPPEPAADTLLCGFLDPYNDAYDKVTARQPVPLKRMEHKVFYPVTTTDDPVLEKLAVDGAADIFITDAILSHLMTCTRSVYPWDIVVQKLPNGVLLFDKRDGNDGAAGSPFDFLTVQETAYQPPSQEEGPERLALEATVVQQNFSQQILKKSGRQHMPVPNPFFDPDDTEVGEEPASVAFRYRKFQLNDTNDTTSQLKTVMVRTELHGLVKQTQYMTAFCLNEYHAPSNNSNNSNNNNNNSSNSNNSNSAWRDKMDAQSGAVLAHELKNNSFQMAKWTAQSLLAGAQQMKLGFVTRSRGSSGSNSKTAAAADHVVLATQFYRPSDFAVQQGLQEGVMWSIFRMFVALMEKQPAAGKYVIMRNPNKALMHLYKVPQDTFEDSDSEDEEGEE